MSDFEKLQQENSELKAELEKYRNWFHQVFHGSTSLKTITRLEDGRILDLNQASASLGGYQREDLIGIKAQQTLWAHPEQRDFVVKKIREEGRLENFEVDFLGTNGEVRTVLFSATPILYNGESCILSECVDITQRKKTELALRESEERFRLITSTIDEIFYIYDAERGRAVYLSPAFERIWGYSSERALDNDRPFINPVHPDDREKVMNWGPLLSKGQPVSYEYRIIREDGSIRHIWDHGFPITEKGGKVKLYVGTGLDVTEWRQAEEALRESKDYLNQIINHIGDPVVVKDSEHRHVLVNNAFCEFIEQAQEDLIGTTGLEQFPKELAESLWKDEERVLKTGKESLTEDIIYDRYGHAHTLLAKKSLLTKKNGEKQIVLAFKDITEYKRLEAQLLQSQKMEAIGALAGGVAHDFNNLLNVINGYSELALESLSESEPVRDDIQQIRDAGRRAAALTAQLLAFGRKQLLQPEIMDLNQTIDQMISMLRRLIGEDIDLIAIAAQNLGRIHADPSKIQQVVLNLVINARDAMPQGGKLSIETADVIFDPDYIREHHPIIQPGRYVMLAISDNGVGMDAETQAHIFEPFFTTKPKGKGTGLGLATVYGIVKQSNGFIWVYSEPGKGTTFKVYFPRTEGSYNRLAAPENSDQDFQGTETVLLVEDEHAVRSFVSRVLHEKGYKVIEAGDGNEALRLADEYPGQIHMILTDVVMPGMGGSTLVAKIESARPDIKALYISGYTDDAIVRHGILDSNIAFLEKPFSVNVLAKKVREVLDMDPAQKEQN